MTSPLPTEAGLLRVALALAMGTFKEACDTATAFLVARQSREEALDGFEGVVTARVAEINALVEQADESARRRDEDTMTVYVGTRMDTDNEGKVTVLAVSTARLVVIEAIKADIDKDISDNPDDDAVESLAILDEPFDPAVGDWSAHGGLTVWQIAECKVIE